MSDNDGLEISYETRMPTIFADAIYHLGYSDHIAKFTLVRTDQPIDKSVALRMLGVAQVVMPIDDFLQSFAFMESRIKDMIEDGTIQQSALDACRETFIEK